MYGSKGQCSLPASVRRRGPGPRGAWSPKVSTAATHRVTAEQIRPLWIWTGAPDGQGSPSWKYELMAGRGVVEEGAAGGSGLQAVFQYTESLARRHSNYFHSLRHSALALGQDSSA